MKFHVPLGTLRDWEQGAKYPDTATRSYLRVIEKAPHIVRGYTLRYATLY